MEVMCGGFWPPVASFTCTGAWYREVRGGKPERVRACCGVAVAINLREGQTPTIGVVWGCVVRV
jgi:hypothetical protein